VKQMDLTNKHVWIVGASSGIGRELAILLCEKFNCVVSVSSRRETALLELVDTLEQKDARVYAFPLDVSERENIAHMCQKIIGTVGPIDIVIANAGVNHGRKHFRKLTPSEVSAVLDTNLTGAIATMQAALPHMLARRSGVLVGVSSLAGYRAVPGCSIYGATKAALSHFLEVLSIELQGTGVRVLDICPGFVATPAIAHLDHPKPFLYTSTQAAQSIISAIQSGRSHAAFPLPLRLVSALSCLLPRFIYRPIMSLIDTWTTSAGSTSTPTPDGAWSGFFWWRWLRPSRKPHKRFE